MAHSRGLETRRKLCKWIAVVPPPPYLGMVPAVISEALMDI